MLNVITFLLAVFACTTHLAAASLDNAQSAYEKGDYTEAIRIYSEAVRAGPPNASILHNLGLAFDRQKELGPAVAAYLRAAQLQPREGDVQYNLRFLLGQGSDKLDSDFPQTVGETALLGRYASEREFYYAALFALGLLTIAIAGSMLSVRMKKSAVTVAILAGVFTLYLGACWQHKRSFEADFGAIAVPKVEAYSGPTQSVVIFELHEGAPFQIVDATGDWIKIKLSDQKQGWVRKDSVASFGRSRILLPENEPSKS